MSNSSIFKTYAPKSKVAVIGVAIDRSNDFLCIGQHLSKNKPTLTLFELNKKDAYRVIEMSNPVYSIFFKNNQAVIYSVNNANDFFVLHEYNIETKNIEVLYEFKNNYNQLFLPRFGEVVLLLEEENMVFYNFLKKEKTHIIPLTKIDKKDVSNLKVNIFDDNSILVNGEEGKLNLYDFIEHKNIKHFLGNFDEIEFVGTSKNICYAVGEFGRGIFIWDKETANPIKGDFLNDPDFVVLSVAISSDEQFLALGNHVGFISIINLHSGSLVFSERIHKRRIHALQFSHNDEFLISGGGDAQVHLIRFN